MHALLIGFGLAPENGGPPLRERHAALRDFLMKRGFTEQSATLFFGNDRVTAIDCVLAVQELRRAYDWFQSSVRDIRMLRIEENNDLGPAVE